MVNDMKKIYVNIWDDFEGFEDGDGGTTTMYIENDNLTVDQEEYVLRNIADQLGYTHTEVNFNTYGDPSMFGFERWEIILYNVNENRICGIVDYFGQLRHTIVINDEPHEIEVYAES
ncbi:hypothetical protein 65p342 [Aeromonas phage 65]|uniref:Uncharacterized protein n=2 Tax=Ishigurovirus osborne TaxID=260149 RepID=E5DSH6_9CAUD|nr:hypothetical protein ST65p342 [Aeromonas phage 65]ADQ53350.1 hypothetical protein 65p342 [Aeromonas phage 65]